MTTTIGGGDRVGLGAATLFSVGITLVFGSNLARRHRHGGPPVEEEDGTRRRRHFRWGVSIGSFAAVLAAMGQESVREL